MRILSRPLLGVILVITLLLLSFYSFSQNAKQIKRLETDADQLFQSELWAEALDSYLVLDSLSPNTAEYQFRTGVIYYNSIDKGKSLKYFLDAISNGKKDVNLDYYLAEAYHFNLYFDSALVYYKRCLSIYDSVGQLDDELRKEIEKSITDCQYAEEITNEPLEIPITNIGIPINSSFPEYVPLVSADERLIIFTSRRPNTTGRRQDLQGQFMEDIYLSKKNQDGSWSEPDNKLPFNTKGHDACVGLNPEGTRLIIYRSENRGDLYFSELNGDTWTEPVPISNKVNTIHWESSACFSTDGIHLYFTSDKPGGYGGSDIYRATINENLEWDNIENLGPVINTPYDEDAPKIHSDDKTMFFSSKGHKSIGGYDIFSSVYDEKTGEWETPRNIGYPINTPGDDIYFTLLTNGEKGFFSSYRPDTYGEKDIYAITRPESVPTKFIMKFKLFDHFHNRPINAKIKLIDSETKEEYEITPEDTEEGKYSFTLDFETNYKLKIDAPGYKFQEKNLSIDYRADIFEYVMNIAPKRTEVIEIIDSIALVRQYQTTIEMEEMDNDMVITDPAMPGFVPSGDPFVHLTTIPTIDSEINSETASISEKTNNIEKEELELDQLQLQKQATSESSVASNSDQNISSNLLPENNSEETTRVESDSQPSDHVIPADSRYISKDLFKSAISSGVKSKEIIETMVKEGSEVVFITRIDNSEKVAIPLIYYEFDDYYLAEDARSNLDNLAIFLNNNRNLCAILGGHTDSIGWDNYKRDLSLYRAGGVKLYLLSKGVSKEQLYVMPMSEELPILSNSTFIGRKTNRRVGMTFVDINDPVYQNPPFNSMLKNINLEIKPQSDYITPYIIWGKMPLSVHFQRNEASFLTEYSRKKLDQLAEYIDKVPYRLIITGYLDPNDENDNLNLASKRTETVLNYLKSKGIGPEKFIIIENESFNEYFDIWAVEPGISRRRVQFYVIRN